MIYLHVADINIFEGITNWANGGFSSWMDNDVEGLITVMTPGPWNVILGFCDSRKTQQEVQITRLLLLKNIVPSYYLNCRLEPGIITKNVWDEICYSILFHNPGLHMTLSRFENEYF